jgi:hypothetical protein
MAAIPADYLDLLRQKTTFAHLATIMPDGTTQVTPVWFDYTNGKIRVNSAKGRLKARNMQSPLRCRPRADLSFRVCPGTSF